MTFYVTQFEKRKELKMVQQQERQSKWEPSHVDMYEINVDGAFSVATGKGGWGFIARNSTGEFFWKGLLQSGHFLSS